ncbi:hypothetical protein PENTCL1PPCAC_4219, partial [Pristionchus entomophagus]
RGVPWTNGKHWMPDDVQANPAIIFIAISTLSDEARTPALQIIALLVSELPADLDLVDSLDRILVCQSDSVKEELEKFDTLLDAAVRFE